MSTEKPNFIARSLPFTHAMWSILTSILFRTIIGLIMAIGAVFISTLLIPSTTIIGLATATITTITTMITILSTTNFITEGIIGFSIIVYTIHSIKLVQQTGLLPDTFGRKRMAILSSILLPVTVITTNSQLLIGTLAIISAWQIRVWMMNSDALYIRDVLGVISARVFLIATLTSLLLHSPEVITIGSVGFSLLALSLTILEYFTSEERDGDKKLAEDVLETI